MDVAVSGASGFLGTALVDALGTGGHRVRRLVRRPSAADDEVAWDPGSATIDGARLAGVEAVVHLAGEGIGARRWTQSQKRRIHDSRTTGTGLLVTTVAALDPRPRVLISASGVGYYGDRGDEELTEESSPGDDWLARVVRDWEAATGPAAEAGIRTVVARTGIVLDPRGGALSRMLLPFRLGLGGPMGGSQWWSWIALDDYVGALLHLLDADVSGPVNMTSPNPVTNADFARSLGQALHRPAVLPTPRIGPDLLLGRQLAESLLYFSAKALPTRLLGSGYRFRHPDLGPALRALLARPAA